MARVERWMGVVASAMGVSFLLFAVLAPIQVPGHRFVAHSPGECLAGLGTALNMPGHVSLVSYGASYVILPLIFLLPFLLPVIAAARRARTQHSRWLVALWLLTAGEITVMLAWNAGCNQVFLGPIALLTAATATVGTIAAMRNPAPRSDPRDDEAPLPAPPAPWRS